MDVKDDGGLRDWHEQLPRDASDHPDVWFVRGLWARHLGRLDVAARCFGETVLQVPEHRCATYQISQVLVALDDSSAAEFVERSNLQFQLTHELDLVLRAKTQQSEDTFQEIVGQLESCGRLLEAFVWSVRAIEVSPTSSWSRNTNRRLGPQLHQDMPLTVTSANLALKHNLRRYPLPDELFRATNRKSPTESVVSTGRGIRFDDGQHRVLNFVFENGADPQTKGARLFEQTGGGVAVIDFDCDESPDLFFTQGATWPTGSLSPQFEQEQRDRLFRNVEGHAVDVATLALPEDRGFGQGCAVGDFNNDGFADLYVANVGRNQLLVNNGDGTFSDVTDAAGISGEVWTSSCVMVDLNGDSHPDLFDVTYLTGADVFTRICNGRACSPKGFEGVPDRVWLSRGDGTFVEARGATPVENSKGLGVVAFHLKESKRPHLFIANDQVPNHFLRNEPTPDALGFKLSSEGFVMGLAFNEHGLAMAGMGIAADDINADGRLDFLVTNFKDEPNTLYLQDTNGLFSDGTRASGLHGPSVPFVSWGTQFLDADLDGHPDLVVVSGHVDDYRDAGGEYHMRPQFFRNVGSGRFEEQRGSQAGPFFDRLLLERGLAKLDWNRDGRMDFAVSNIGDPASLVLNETSDVGHFLNVKLIATTTSRDAIGASVEIVLGSRTWSKQLLAGDGYMASNERVLQFGLGARTVVDELRVEWPSGAKSVLKNVSADQTLKLVERPTPDPAARNIRSAQ